MSTFSVPPRVASSMSDTTATDEGSSTLLNAAIGGVLGIVVSFVPFSPLLGGGVAGYLEGGTRREGMRVGAMAGLIMLVPFLLFAFVAMGLVAGVGSRAAFFGVLLLFVMVFVAAYTVGLSLLGGYLGAYLKDEY